MSLQASTLWDSIKFEVLNATEDDLAVEALEAIKAIAYSLSFGLKEVPKMSPLTRYLKPVIKECTDLIKEPTHKQAKPAGTILAACAEASAVSHAHIVQTIIPSLLVVYDDLDGIAKQRGLLQSLLPLFDSTIKIYGTWGDLESPPELPNSLLPFKDRFFDLLSRALMSVNRTEVSFRMTALDGLTKLAKLRSYFENNEIGMIVQFLDEVVLTDKSQDLKYAYLTKVFNKC